MRDTEKKREKRLPIYGMDALGVFLLLLYIAASLLFWITRSFITQFFAIPLVVIFLLRFFSRSPWRRRENEIFLAPIRFIPETWQLARCRRRDPEHLFTRCPSCRRILRLTREAGVREVVCPRCRATFLYRVP